MITRQALLMSPKGRNVRSKVIPNQGSGVEAERGVYQEEIVLKIGLIGINWEVPYLTFF